jgi:hypothetical protein
VSDNHWDGDGLRADGRSIRAQRQDPRTSDTDGGFTSAPTGQVFRNGAGFMGDKFIVDSEDGTIPGWQTSVSPSSFRPILGRLRLQGAWRSSKAAPARLVAANCKVPSRIQRRTPRGEAGLRCGLTGAPAGFAAFNVAAIRTNVYISLCETGRRQGGRTAGPATAT